MDQNKVKYGLKNVHYAAIHEAIDGSVTYDAPKHVPGAVNLALDAEGEKVEFFADDEAYYEEYNNNGYAGSLEMALIPDEFRVDVLGDMIDVNGALIENRDAAVKKFALLFEFDGDKNKTRHVVYNVLPTRPSIAGETKKNAKEPKTDSMNITARPAPDTGDIKAKVKQGDTAYDDFYTAVYIKDAPTNAASYTATFEKAVPADVVIEVTSSDMQNTVKNVLLNGTPIPGTSLTVAGLSVTIDQVALSDLAVGSHIIVIELLRGNAVTVTLAVS